MDPIDLEHGLKFPVEKLATAKKYIPCLRDSKFKTNHKLILLPTVLTKVKNLRLKSMCSHEF